jgi:hypothetical protein
MPFATLIGSSPNFITGPGYLGLTNIQRPGWVQAALSEWLQSSGAPKMVVEMRNDFLTYLNIRGKLQQPYITKNLI